MMNPTSRRTGRHDPEQRQSARIPIKLYAQVLGIDEDDHLRPGNISLSGVFFETDGALPKVGTLERIRLESEDRAHSVTTTACLVRVAHTTDFWAGEQIAGAAFQFLPDDATVRAKLDRLLRHIAGDELQAELLRAALEHPMHPPEPSDSFDAMPGSRAERLKRDRLMSMEFSFALDAGSEVSVQIAPPGDARPVEVRGIVMKSTAIADGRFRVDVDLSHASSRLSAGRGSQLEDALVSLLDKMAGTDTEEAIANADQALMGAIHRVPLTSLFSFLEWEEWSGALEVNSDEGDITVFFDRGHPIDADENGFASEQPVATIGRLLSWRDGVFTLKVGTSGRPDRIDMPVRALLMELARADDEETRD